MDWTLYLAGISEKLAAIALVVAFSLVFIFFVWHLAKVAHGHPTAPPKTLLYAAAVLTVVFLLLPSKQAVQSCDLIRGAVYAAR